MINFIFGKISSFNLALLQAELVPKPQETGQQRFKIGLCARHSQLAAPVHQVEERLGHVASRSLCGRLQIGKAELKAQAERKVQHINIFLKDDVYAGSRLPAPKFKTSRLVGELSEFNLEREEFFRNKILPVQTMLRFDAGIEFALQGQQFM